ncbi:hypothetical protein E2C01_006048 [Portunus trituberculatus]|uniref:Uncharacterized protein n=1 Tax=Portunus trituberculatus TaxID=210409 RepID=A0A5B7CU46_PORTR|nr:hypothetical protein [Portunus trituberculatus]
MFTDQTYPRGTTQLGREHGSTGQPTPTRAPGKGRQDESPTQRAVGRWAGAADQPTNTTSTKSNTSTNTTRKEGTVEAAEAATFGHQQNAVAAAAASGAPNGKATGRQAGRRARQRRGKWSAAGGRHGVTKRRP